MSCERKTVASLTVFVTRNLVANWVLPTITSLASKFYLSMPVFKDQPRQFSHVGKKQFLDYHDYPMANFTHVRKSHWVSQLFQIFSNNFKFWYRRVSSYLTQMRWSSQSTRLKIALRQWKDFFLYFYKWQAYAWSLLIFNVKLFYLLYPIRKIVITCMLTTHGNRVLLCWHQKKDSNYFLLDLPDGRVNKTE